MSRIRPREHLPGETRFFFAPVHAISGRDNSIRLHTASYREASIPILNCIKNEYRIPPVRVWERSPRRKGEQSRYRRETPFPVEH